MDSQKPSTSKTLTDRLDNFNEPGPYEKRESKRPPPTDRSQTLRVDNIDRRESEVSEVLHEASLVGLPISEDGEDEDKQGWDNFGGDYFIDSTNNEYIEHDFDYANPEISAEPDNPEVQEPQGRIEESEWDQGNTSEEPDWQEA